MFLKEYLSGSGNEKKILIVSRQARANQLLRRYERETGDTTRNVNCDTLGSVVDTIYRCEQSKVGFLEGERLIEDDEAVRLLRGVLFEQIDEGKIHYFASKQMLSFSVVKEIYKMVCLVRSNGWNGREEQESNDRIRDLKVVIPCFEALLAEKKLHDRVARYQAVEKIIRGWVDPKAELSLIFGAKFDYLKEETENFTGLEKTLLTLLGCDEVLLQAEDETSLDKLKEKLSGKTEFFRGYGSFNEVNYVANDILQKGTPFGNVTVLYSSSEQVPAITSALRGNKIPVSVVSSHSVKDNPYLGLIKSILTWAEDDYTESRLEEIFANPVIYAEYLKEITEEKKEGEGSEEELAVERAEEEELLEEQQALEMESIEETETDEGDDTNTASEVEIVSEERKKYKKVNALAGDQYFGHVLSAAKRRNERFKLGWGYERNVEFIQHEKEILNKDNDDLKKEIEENGPCVWKVNKNERRRVILDLHEALLAIFGQDGKEFGGEERPVLLYERLLAFMETYSKKRDLERAVGMGVLRNQREIIAGEMLEASFADNCKAIRELLDSAMVQDSSRSDTVTVQSLNDWRVLDRPLVYMIGLSLKEMLGKQVESPILTDEEMEDFLGEGEVPTLNHQMEQKKKNLDRTLSTFDGERIIFGYSSFDTGSHCINNPSGFFRNMLDIFSGEKRVKPEELPEFVYGNPKVDVVVERSKDIPEKAVLPKTIEAVFGEKTSSSLVESLLECPKKYAYGKLGIPENQYTEVSYDRWMDAALRGSFFHELSKRYCDEKLIRPATEAYDFSEEEIEECITRIVKEIAEEYLGTQPVACQGLVHEASEEMTQKALEYFQQLQSKLNGSELGWRVLMAEQRFEGATYDVEDYTGKKWSMTYNGEIDRVDYKIMPDERKVYLRIIDYKTGKKDKKEGVYNQGALYQYLLYREALMRTGKGKKAPEDDTFESMLQLVKEKVAELEEHNEKVDKEDLAKWDCVFQEFRYEFPMDSDKTGGKGKFPIIEDKNIEGINVTRMKSILTSIAEKKTYPDRLELYSAIKEFANEKRYGKTDTNLAVLQMAIEKEDKIVTGKRGSGEDYCKYCSYQELCTKRKAGDL